MLQFVAYVVFVAASVLSLAGAEWALAMTVSMYPLEQLLQSGGGIFLSSPALANALIAGIASVAATKVVLRAPRPLLGYLSSTWLAIVLIYSWSCISLLWSPSATSGGELILGGLPYFVLFILIAPLLATDLASIRKFTNAFLMLGTVIAGALVINPEFRSSSGRQVFMLTGSSMSNPLVTGELGGSLIIIAALVRGDGLAPIVTLARFIAFPLGLALALQSGSRGQLIAAVIVVVVCYPLSRKIASVAGFVGATLLLVVGYVAISALAPALLTGYGLTRWEAGNLERGISGRLNNSLDLIGAQLQEPMSWLIGLGYNAFESVSDGRADGYSHNLSVDVLSELGVPCFALYVWTLAMVGRSAHQLMGGVANDPPKRSTVAILLALALYQFVLMHKQGYLWGAGACFMYMIIIRRVSQRERALATDSGSGEKTSSSWTELEPDNAR